MKTVTLKAPLRLLLRFFHFKIAFKTTDSIGNHLRPINHIIFPYRLKGYINYTRSGTINNDSQWPRGLKHYFFSVVRLYASGLESHSSKDVYLRFSGFVLVCENGSLGIGRSLIQRDLRKIYKQDSESRQTGSLE